MILVPISPGELIDRITILDIKRTRIADVARSANVAFELALLRAVRDRAVSRSTEIARLAAELTLPKGTIHVISDVHGEDQKL
ncbi:MAG TPA: fructose-bisphosphatase class III, partial [Candidatus Binatia bacterium]|nr:fructose-bisphosphatase class III [Candidatus Binatia bacterium]